MPLTRISTPFITGFLMAALAGPVAGQPSSPPSGSGAAASSSTELAKARQKARNLQKKIRDLQSKALENNPELRKRQEQLKKQVQKKMAGNGFSPDQRQRLKSLKANLGNQGSGKAPNRKRMKEFQKLMKARSQARQQAMQDPAIQKARKAFREDLMAAMKEHNPKTPQLVSKLRKHAREFRRLRRQQASQPKDGAQASQP